MRLSNTICWNSNLCNKPYFNNKLCPWLSTSKTKTKNPLVAHLLRARKGTSMANFTMRYNISSPSHVSCFFFLSKTLPTHKLLHHLTSKLKLQSRVSPETHQTVKLWKIMEIRIIFIFLFTSHRAPGGGKGGCTDFGSAHQIPPQHIGDPAPLSWVRFAIWLLLFC